MNTEQLISYHVNNELPVLLLSLKIDNDLLDQYSELRLECRAALFETVANFQTKLNVHVQQQLQSLSTSLATDGILQSTAGWPQTLPVSTSPSRSRVNGRRKKRPPNDPRRLNLFNQLDYEPSMEDAQSFSNLGEYGLNRFSRNEISALRNHQMTLHQLRIEFFFLIFTPLIFTVFTTLLPNL